MVFLRPLGDATSKISPLGSMSKAVFKLDDAQSFSGLTSKILPLGALLNFDADVNNMTARHQCESSFKFGRRRQRTADYQCENSLTQPV